MFFFGPDPNNQMIAAARAGEIDGVQVALIAGADVHYNQDATLCLAVWHGHVAMVSYLISTGADVHANHDEALRRAARDGDVPLCRILLASGADPVSAWKWHTYDHDEASSCLAAILDACGEAMTAAQRAVLAAQSPLFVSLRASLNAAQVWRHWQRRRGHTDSLVHEPARGDQLQCGAGSHSRRRAMTHCIGKRPAR